MNPEPIALADQTDVGSYFVATYPPFSVWSEDAVDRDARAALAVPGDPAVPLGLYLHIPFCRKRCHFCYFRVYTDKNAQEIGRYLDVLGKEWEMRSLLTLEGADSPVIMSQGPGEYEEDPGGTTIQAKNPVIIFINWGSWAFCC